MESVEIDVYLRSVVQLLIVLKPSTMCGDCVHGSDKLRQVNTVRVKKKISHVALRERETVECNKS